MSEPKKLKVCFIAGTLGRGGAERQLVFMLRALKRAGVSARVLCLTRGEPYERVIEESGVPVEWVGARQSRPLRLLRIVRSLRREPADILQSTHFYTNLYAAAAARLTGAREIGAVRSDLFRELRMNGVMGRGHLFAPRHLVVNSDLARRRAVELGVREDRVFMVANVVDAQTPNRGRETDARLPVRVLFAGRLIDAKRPELFLRVMSNINRRLPGQPVKAVVAGKGPLQTRLVAMAPALGLGPDQLELLGEQSDMDSVYRKTDLLMLTSEREGTPNVLLEAMAYAIPVVATRVGGVPDIVGDGHGLLLDPDDEEGLTAAAIRLIKDSQLRSSIGRRGHAYVTRHHSLDALATRLRGIYDGVLAR